MRLTKKRISIAGLGAVCALSIAVGASVLAANNEKTAFADETAIPSSEYYYDNLTDAEGNEYTLAKEFYKVFAKMHNDGDFKDGVVQYDLEDVVTSEQIASWVSGGDLTVPKAFSAARDSYYYDHPELFYIDIYKLTLSAGRIDDDYVAYIDCGREANCYIDGGFSSEAEVEQAITAFNGKVDTIVEYVRAEAAKDTYDTAEEVLYAQWANSYIASNTVYDDRAYSNFVNTGSHNAPYAQNAYGALVVGESVCYGYSFAYKAVMDKLGVPCIVIGGTSISVSTDGTSSSDNGEAHAWNYVWYADSATAETEEQAIAAISDKVEGSWYAYDVTWNSSRVNKSTYANMAAFAASQNHLPDPVISTSNYEMPYPSLAVRNYGATRMSGGILVTQQWVNENYDDALSKDDVIALYESVSVNDKGAVRLFEDDGLRLIYRQAHYAAEGEVEGIEAGQLIWSYWNDVYAVIKEGAMETAYEDSGNQTKIYHNTYVLYTQYAVVKDIEPDTKWYPAQKTASLYTNIDIGEYAVYATEVLENKAFMSYVAAPYVVKSSLDLTRTHMIYDWMAAPNSSIMADKYAFEIVVTYDEPMHAIDPSKPISVSYTTKYEFSNLSKYALFVPYEDGSLVKLSEDGYTLSFKFKPSLMYEHNRLMYSFYFENIGSMQIRYKADGVTTFISNKAPNAVHYCFSRWVMACPLILGGGRLWVDCCAFPQLVSDTNLAETQFEDENGNLFTTNASQMMLVVESVDEKTENAMLDGIKNIEDSNITREDIKKSETYDIDLQTCGRYSKIPDGSHVKISLGFPEGYGPEDEGVVFKVYHRKHVQDDEYIIEEIPCVVTKLGIVATVNNFSPYMVAVVDASKATSDKYIYAAVDGKGGKLSLEDAEVKTVKEGETVSFAITPDAGYQLYRVTLNDEDITSRVNNGTLTLTYAELDSNSAVEIQYIAEAAAQRYENIGAVTPLKVYVPVEDQPKRPTAMAPAKPLATVDDGNNPSDNTALIIAIVVIAAVLAIGGAAIAFVVIRKKQPTKAAASAQPKAKKAQSKPAATTAAKPAAAAQPKTATTTTAKPATTTKSATTAKPASTAKPTATVKPVAKPVTKPTTKPTGKK